MELPYHQLEPTTTTQSQPERATFRQVVGAVLQACNVTPRPLWRSGAFMFVCSLYEPASSADATVNEAAAIPAIALVTIDRETGSAVLSRSDGKEARVPLCSRMFANTSALSRLHWTPDGGGLLAVTRAGDDIAFEMPRRDGPDGPRGRLVVYLDQNQWSLLARCTRVPADVKKEDLAAAEQIADWSRQRRIVLSASAGHYFETMKWREPARRYSLGLTVLQLSCGWQMRDPLLVRRDEIHDAFRCAFADGTGTRSSPVFMLRPNVLHGPPRGGPPHQPPADFPPDIAYAREALTSAIVLIDVMLDAEHVESGPSAGWPAVNQQFSDWLDGEKRDAQQKRRSIDALLMSDLQREIAEEAHTARATSEQMSQWIGKSFAAGISALPATGLFRELLHEKHLNKGSRWVPNDLTDMIYLSCAAGYADIVVCERFTAAALSRGQRRLGRTPNAFRTLREAVPAVEAALAASAR